MSQLSKHSENRIVWTIGNTQIVESEPDQGIIPTMKAAFLGIAAITAAPVSPVIAIALAGYAAMKVFESFNLNGREAREIASNIYNDVNGVETETETVPTEWVPMPQALPEETRYQPSPQTKLGAINVPARSAQTEDIARSLAEQLQSTLIVGQSGAGKGLTIAYATRWIKKLHPECQIWAIDPKSDPSEADYWTACDRVLNCPIRPFTPAEDMEAIQAQIDAFIAEFQGSHAPMKLLIFDEALAVKEKTGKWFKGLMAGFNALCSMGRSSKQYGWLVSQSPNTDDFGISGGTRNVYRRVLLLARSNLGLIANGSTFFAGKPTTEQLMQTGRVYFDSISNEWGVTPVYPDLVKQTNQMQPSRRQTLETLIQSEADHPIEQFYHSNSVEPDGNEIDSGELAIRAEIKRFLLANSDGSKPRDLSARARKPVKGMPTDDIKFYLDVMALEGEIYEVDGTFFVNT